MALVGPSTVNSITTYTKLAVDAFPSSPSLITLVYETDTNTVYEFDGTGTGTDIWHVTKRTGATSVFNQLPYIAVDTRRIIANTTGLTTDTVAVTAATPSLSTQLVGWSTFSNTPKSFTASSIGEVAQNGILGWVYVINAASAAAATTIINDALNATGAAISQATPVAGNTTQLLGYIPFNGKHEYTHNVEITSMYIAPISITSPAVAGIQAYCQVEFK